MFPAVFVCGAVFGVAAVPAVLFAVLAALFVTGAVAGGTVFPVFGVCGRFAVAGFVCGAVFGVAAVPAVLFAVLAALFVTGAVAGGTVFPVFGVCGRFAVAGFVCGAAFGVAAVPAAFVLPWGTAVATAGNMAPAFCICGAPVVDVEYVMPGFVAFVVYDIPVEVTLGVF